MDQKIITKPWGNEVIWSVTNEYAAKILTINARHQLSLQYHEKKVETIYLESGKMLLLLENDSGNIEEHLLSPGDSRHIPALRKHRMVAIETCRVFEVSTPELDDVVRLSDAYGRT
jgi:mannose-6-phosphate isomerase